MAVRDYVIAILKSSFAQRINFSFTGSGGSKINIVSGDLLTVAAAVKANSIAIVEDPGIAAGMAKYTAKPDGNLNANTFYIGPNDYNSRIFEALMVHEAVHAVFDLKKATLPWIDNESAAYIAQGFYLKNAAFSSKRLSSMSQAYFGLMLAESVTSAGDMEPFWMDALRDSLLSDPHYHNYVRGTFTGDG